MHLLSACLCCRPWHNMGKAVLHLQPFSNSCTDLQSAAVATAAALLRPSLPHSPSRTPLHPWQVWDLAALLHIVAQAGAKAAEDEEPAAIQGAAAKDPVAVLEGDLQEPFGGTHLNLQATDRLAACHNPTVLVRSSITSVCCHAVILLHTGQELSVPVSSTGTASSSFWCTGAFWCFEMEVGALRAC